MNYIDTAYPYHGENFPRAGMSEPLVAKALTGGYREKVFLVTKLPLWHIESRTDMDKYLDEQLRRLNTPYLDIYLAHNLNAVSYPKMRALGLFDFFDTAMKDGRIKYRGFSFHDLYPLYEEIIDAYDWEVSLLQHNYLDVNYQAGEKGLALAARKNIAIMEPLRGGFLVNNLPTEAQANYRALHPDWSFAEWALRYLWNKPEIGVVLSGMSSLEQVEQNVRSAATEFSFGEKELIAIAAARRIFIDRLKVNCTACGYCLPCPQGVAIPKVFAYYNEFYLNGDTTPMPKNYSPGGDLRIRSRMFYNATITPEQRADRCVACGVCETRCPQKIPIAQTMPQVAALLQ